MKILNIFKNFYFLNEPDLTYKYKMEDKFLGDSFYLRINEDFKIYHLYSSFQTIIPKEYMTISSNLDRMEGQCFQEIKTETPLENFIYNLWDIQRNIRFGNDIKENLSGILELGTKEFRNFMEKEFKIILRPWKMENIKKSKEI